MGMLKSRIARASNPINLEGIDQVVARQSEAVAKYAGLAIPVRDFSKLWNTAEPGWQDSLHNAVAHKWGASGVKYLDNLMADIQMGRDRDSTIITRFLGRLRRNYAQSVLTLNPNSAVSQVSGYPTAASVLGWKAVNRGWKDGAAQPHGMDPAEGKHPGTVRPEKQSQLGGENGYPEPGRQGHEAGQTGKAPAGMAGSDG